MASQALRSQFFFAPLFIYFWKVFTNIDFVNASYLRNVKDKTGTMENEKHKGWNEYNKNIFCSIEADDDSVDILDGDTNSLRANVTE